MGDRVAGRMRPVKLVHSGETEPTSFQLNVRKMCELAHGIGSDADSGSSRDDWRHNIWNPLLDMLAEYRTGQCC